MTIRESIITRLLAQPMKQKELIRCLLPHSGYGEGHIMRAVIGMLATGEITMQKGGCLEVTA